MIKLGFYLIHNPELIIWIEILKLRLFFSIWLLLPSYGIAEGAFGIEFGSQLTDTTPIPDVAGLFEISPEKPNEAFESYAVIYEPSLGVCKITANTAINSNDGFGKKAVRQYEKIREELIDLYGAGSKHEFMSANADLDDDDEFALSLHKDARIHSTLWAVLSPAIYSATANVSLDIKAIKDSTWVNVSYESTFFSECMEKIKTQLD